MLREALLRRVQSHIPLIPRPFEAVARELGATEKEVIRELEELKKERIVRQISPIYDAKAVGYDSALVAFRVEPDRLEAVARCVGSNPGVSHNYEREHEFNLWFTIAVPPDAPLSLEDTVSRMAKEASVRDFVILRTVRSFKLNVKLDYERLNEREEAEIRQPPAVRRIPSEEEKAIIRLTQKDIPLVPRPFALLARELGVSEEYLLSRLNSLREEGIMRRFSAILHHRRAGFRANGMTVWKVPPERVEEVGRYLASFKSVSHCYERTTNHLWEFNLFTMIHGRSREEVTAFVERVGKEIRLENYQILFSTREFKKRRIELFSEEFYEREGKQVGVHTHQGEDLAGGSQALLPEGI